MEFKVGFIGCGNMGSALLKGIVEKIGAKNCCVSEKEKQKAQNFIDLGVSYLTSSEVVLKSEYVFLAVKPQVMKEVVSSFPKSEATFITMAAGLELESIENYLGEKAPVIRIMPNLPCGIKKGVILYCYNSLVDEKKLNNFKFLLEDLGLIDEISEEKMDIASVVSGCGPAYAYMFIKSIADSATECGLDDKKAILYALRTVEGAAKMIEHSKEDIETLINNVCSPKGTTIEGVETLRNKDFAKIVDEAVKASFTRAKELK